MREGGEGPAFIVLLHCPRRTVTARRQQFSNRLNLQSKIFYLMAQVVFWFPSMLPFPFLISDIPGLPCKLLSCAGMRGQRISQADSCQCGQKATSPKCWRGPMQAGGVGLGQ